MSWANETGSFALGDFAAEKGGVIREARLAWQRFGTLNDKRDNLILYPSAIRALSPDMSWRIEPEGILDPTRWCIVAAGMFSNGESLRRGGDAGLSRTRHRRRQCAGATPSRHGNVRRRQTRRRYGFSMGGMQAYHWAALYPDMVERAFVVCGSARTADHNKVFLSGLLRTLEAAPSIPAMAAFRASRCWRSRLLATFMPAGA